MSAAAFPPASLLPLTGQGPEDVVVDQDGALLCGVAGGRILRIDADRGTVATVGDTGGRPLGLEILRDGRVVVCDADRGLLRLDPTSGVVETLVEAVDGVPLRFCSNAVATRDGTFYFTESTTRFDFAHYLGSFLEHRPSGRLLRRNPDGTVDIVLDQLYFPNGIALTTDESALLYAETAGYRISRLSLAGADAGGSTVVADNLPGMPDNLSRFVDGRAWVAMPSARNPGLDRLATLPGWAAKAVWALPDRLRPKTAPTTWVMAIDESGQVVADLQQSRADFGGVTGVAERDGELFCAGPDHHSLLRFRIPTSSACAPTDSEHDRRGDIR